MNKKQLIFFLLQLTFLIIIAIFCINMGEGGKQVGIEPSYVPLEDDEPTFEGKIYDDKNIIDVKEISFTGHTKIGGIRKEDDDSYNRIDLSKIKELKIKKPLYVSQKYSDKEFILASATANNDSLISDLLIPRQVVICAIDKTTGMEKAWFLYKVKKIEIKKEPAKFTETVTIEEEVEEKGFVGKIGTGIKKGIEKIQETIEVK